MILSEIFDREVSGVSFVPVAELTHITGVSQMTKEACVFEIGEALYIVYFGRTPSMSADSYVFGFGVIDEMRLRHDLVGGTINPLEVYNRVLKAVAMLLHKTGAETVAFAAHEPRQAVLYPKLLKKLGNRIPGYEVDAEHMIIHKVKHR